MKREPQFNEVSVHDPACFFDKNDDKFYVFGTHFAVAESSDLTCWKSVGGAQALFASDWRTVLKKAVAYSGRKCDVWAPHLLMHDKTYYLYFSLTTAFGSGKSFIGRVRASSPLGPYDDEVEIVKSEEGPGNPNAIDPNLFFDKEGRLWMVYGSFFGGIFIKEMYAEGEKFGLPKEDGYGKRLWHGDMQDGPEGPYIFYDKTADYYYLCVSSGSLFYNYNIRIARSRRPDGPYTDACGTLLASATGGDKLAGNYCFAGGRKTAALGHNSVLQIGDTTLCFCHARFGGENDEIEPEFFRLRVHAMYRTAEDWWVLSPCRYAGERPEKYTRAQVAGGYDLVRHAAGNDRRFVHSSRYEFAPDGAVRRESRQCGSWRQYGDGYVSVRLGGACYDGVCVPVFSPRYGWTRAVCARSPQGLPLWAIRDPKA